MTMTPNNRVRLPKLSITSVLLSVALGVLAGYAIDQFYRRIAGVPNVRKLDAVRNQTLAISPAIDYRLDLSKEDFYVWLPKTLDVRKPAGLIVYSSPCSVVEGLPAGWEDVLSKRNLILVAPERAGNDCSSQARRMGLCVLGALSMLEKYPIDRHRVYAAGLSGGARTAAGLAFYQPDLFAGTIQSCGTDFCRKVPREFARNATDSNGYPYGYINVEEKSRLKAWRDVRFVLITGHNDFREGNIRDIYSHGFLADGYKCLLIDDPKMGHQDSSAENLEKALDFIGEKGS